MYFCYSKYKFLVDSGTSEDFELRFTFDLDSYANSKETWLALGENADRECLYNYVLSSSGNILRNVFN